MAEYLATAEAFYAKDATKASTDPAATQRALQDVLTPKNLTVLDFAPAVDTNGFVVTKATADRLRLTKMSDLSAVVTRHWCWAARPSARSVRSVCSGCRTPTACSSRTSRRSTSVAR